MTFFLVIDLVLRIFPFFSHIFRMFTMLNVVYMTISSQEKHNFHSVHAFTHIRQHYFSKYWGDQCMGGPPTSTFGGTVPPVPSRSPPLMVPNVGCWLRFCVLQTLRRMPVSVLATITSKCLFLSIRLKSTNEKKK